MNILYIKVWISSYLAAHGFSKIAQNQPCVNAGVGGGYRHFQQGVNLFVTFTLDLEFIFIFRLELLLTTGKEGCLNYSNKSVKMCVRTGNTGKKWVKTIFWGLLTSPPHFPGCKLKKTENKPKAKAYVTLRIRSASKRISQFNYNMYNGNII